MGKLAFHRLKNGAMCRASAHAGSGDSVRMPGDEALQAIPARRN